jgi:hypothetical protein
MVNAPPVDSRRGWFVANQFHSQRGKWQEIDTVLHEIVEIQFIGIADAMNVVPFDHGTEPEVCRHGPTFVGSRCQYIELHGRTCMFRRTRLIVGVLAAIATLFATQLPASAHHDIVYHGNDEASVSSDHGIGYVCDKEYDGNKVTAHFYPENGDTVSISDPDGDGVEGPGHNGCWELTLSSPAVAMAVCEATKNCVVDENI